MSRSVRPRNRPKPRIFVVFYLREGVPRRRRHGPSDTEPVATMVASDRELVMEAMVGQGAGRLGLRPMDRGDAVLDTETGILSILHSRGWREVVTGASW